MKEIRYQEFSLNKHFENLSNLRPSTCQFELTFDCGLDCRHCFTSPYNKKSYLKDELAVEQVKAALDKIHRAGVLWLCFTGGDPLSRRDFPLIYSYAKKKGFLITVFTSGYSLAGKVLDLFSQKPPFSIEITLNAATEKLYEKISQRHGSFGRVVKRSKQCKLA